MANFLIHGFRKGNEVTIKVHYLITYPFGHSYHDDVLYDVGVEMDACHLLLGWPWQYDRRIHKPSTVGTKILACFESTI